MTQRGTTTNADELLSQLPGSPSCFAQKLDLIRSAVLLIQFGEDAYRASSFLDDRILGPSTKGAWLPYNRVVDAARLVRNARPLHFILHTGHVGSTLVSRLLDETGSVLSLREPLPLRTLAEAHDVLGRPDSLLGEAQFELALDTFMRLWTRGYASTRSVVVKTTSNTARMAPTLFERHGAPHAIYLNLRAEPYLATLLAGQNSPVDLRGHGAERMRRLRSRVTTRLAPLHALSLGELAAMSWLVESLTQRDIVERFPDRVVAIDFDGFLTDVAGWMRRILGHFGLPLDPEYLAQVSESAVLARYSKAPEHPYGPGLRSQVLSDARRAHRKEIALGMAWLERLAHSEAAVARVLEEANS